MKEMLAKAKRTPGHGMRGQSGQSALFMVLVLLVVAALVVGPLLGLMGTGLKAGQMHESSVQQLYAADSGVEDAIYWLLHGKDTEGYWTWDEAAGFGERDPYPDYPYKINDMSVDVTVERMDDVGANIYKVTSTATSVDGSSTVLSTVWAVPESLGGFDSLDPHETWDGNVYIEGDDTLKNHCHIVGDVVVTGDLTLNAWTGITGNIGVEGDFTLNAQTNVTGNLCSSGNITIKAQAVLNGDILLSVNGSQTIELQGNAEVGDIYVTSNVTSNVTGNNTVTISLKHNDTVGNIYVTESVQLIQDFHQGATYEDIYDGNPPNGPNWDGEDPPECPGMPVSGARILTYELL